MKLSASKMIIFGFITIIIIMGIAFYAGALSKQIVCGC